MKKKVLIYICIVVMIPILLLFYEKKDGTPPVLTVDGTNITLGVSKLGDLRKNEFDFKLAGGGRLLEKIPANSWLSNLLSAEKNDEVHAYLHIYNPTKEAVFDSEASICEINFFMHSDEYSYWTPNNILVNGINFYGMNADEVKAAMQDLKAPRESSGNLIYKDGKYSYFIYFDDNGLVKEVDVEMTIPKSYN